MPRIHCVALLLVVTAFYSGSSGRAEPRAGEQQQPAEKVRTDLYGDALPRGAIARLGTLRWRVDLNNFTRVSMSCDGTIAALQREDHGVNLWDTSTGKEVTWFKPDLSMKAVLFAPDGKTLLIAKGKSDGKRAGEGEVLWTIEHREVGTGKLQKQVEVASTREHLEFPQFSQDGKFFLAKGAKNRRDFRDGPVTLWDVSTGTMYATFPEAKVFFDRFTVSADGKILAAANEDGSLSLRELPGGRELHRLPRVGTSPRSDHYNPTFSPDGGTLVTSFVDRDTRSLYFWDVASGKLRHEIKDRGGRVAFSPDGKSLVCAETRAFRLFDTTTFKELRSFERNDDYGARCLDFSADGKRLLSGQENTIAVWDVATGKRLCAAPGHDTSITFLAFAPDSRSLASGARGGTAYVWDLKTCRPRHQFPDHSSTVSSLAFSPDGTTLAAGEGDSDGAGSDKVDVRLWDLGRGELRRKFTAHLCGVRSLAFSPDGKSLASAGYDEPFRVWDPATGKQRFEIPGHKDNHPKTIGFSPDGRTLLVAGAKGDVSLWDVGEQKKLRDLGPQEGREVHFAAFVRDGKAVLTCEGGRDKPECRFWSVASGELLKTVPGPRSNQWLRLAISPDGTLLADLSEDEREEGIRLWHVESGAPVAFLRGHTPWIGALAFSPDGKTLASGGGDTTILLWDLTQARLSGLDKELMSADVPGGSLTVSSARTVPFLKEWLGRVAGAEKQARPLLPKLDDDDFETRDQAATALEKLGLSAEPVLREVLEGTIPTETRSRIERILKSLDIGRNGVADEGGRLRRVVKALEAIDSSESSKALKELAHGDAALTVTKLAREAVERSEHSR